MNWILSVALLALLYLTVLGTLSWPDAALGAGWAALAGWWGAAHLKGGRQAAARGPSWAVRAVWLIPFVVMVLVDGLKNGLKTLRAVSGRGARPGLIEVPIGTRSRIGIAVTALRTTVSPGSVFLETDERRGVMLFHYVDAADPEGVRRSHARFYERYQRRVFP